MQNKAPARQKNRIEVKGFTLSNGVHAIVLSGKDMLPTPEPILGFAVIEHSYTPAVGERVARFEVVPVGYDLKQMFPVAVVTEAQLLTGLPAEVTERIEQIRKGIEKQKAEAEKNDKGKASGEQPTEAALPDVGEDRTEGKAE